jgi:predicted nuclease of predicted toxin-antitoxin system
MPLRILCDENLPTAVITALQEWVFTATPVESRLKDSEIAFQAKEEKCIILTFDSDFSNILAYPSSDFFGIIRIKISPPFIATILNALRKMFTHFKAPEEFWGKLIILEATTFRVWEEETPEKE